MKGFFTFLFVIAVLAVIGWYTYDPYLKSAIDTVFGEAPLVDNSRRVPATPAVAATPTTAPQKAEPLTTTTPTPTSTTPALPAKSDLDLALEKAYPMPQFQPLLEIVDHWRSVPQIAFPKEIVASEDISYQLIANGRTIGTGTMPAGAPLTPVRLSGDQLTVGSPTVPEMNAQIAVGKTDFRARIESRYQELVGAKRAEVEKKRARARQIAASDPTKLAALTGGAAASPSAAPLNPAEGEAKIALVKESLKRGEVASARLEEAQSFHWNGRETVGGEYAGTYDTVTVHFLIDTVIFGKSEVDYKALLDGNKVHAWIDPFTEDRL